MTSLRALWMRWVRLWDLQEAPTVQAVVRVGLGLVILTDLLTLLSLDLVVPLFAPASAGGFSTALENAHPPLLYRLITPTEATAWLHFGAMLAAAAALTLGFATRSAALLFVLLSAQHAQILPLADRGIDTLLRNVLLILVFSSAGRTLSLDAKLRTGRFIDPQSRPAWPRHLLILQLVLMYFSAGVQKVGLMWTPFGHFDALYMILQDVALARWDGSWLIAQPWLSLTRIGTAVTWLWEWTAPGVLLIYAWRLQAPEDRSRCGDWAVRNHLHLGWVAVGVVFHLMLALTLELGIFPWAMLALYPAFLHPDELRSFGARLRRIGRT